MFRAFLPVSCFWDMLLTFSVSSPNFNSFVSVVKGDDLHERITVHKNVFPASCLMLLADKPCNSVQLNYDGSIPCLDDKIRLRPEYIQYF